MRTGAFYYAISAVSGFSLMALEVLSSRVVAPYTGSSLYAWSSVIGVTLLGLSVGSLLGGRAADRHPGPGLLIRAFLASAAAVALVVPFSGLQEALVSSIDSLALANIAVAATLFLVPSVLIGALQPVIVRLSVDDMPRLGSRYGALSSAWSAGSIAGVFAAGFWLIPYVGTRLSLLAISLALAFSAAAVAARGRASGRAEAACLLAFLLALGAALAAGGRERSPSVVYEDETAYYDAKVVDFVHPEYGRSRGLFLDAGSHSVETERPGPFYTEIGPLFKHLAPSLSKALFLGGGAYTMPRRLKDAHPRAEVTVVETDPDVTRIAEEHFGLAEYDIATRAEDARYFLRRSDAEYDLVFGDAYNSFISIPWHLATAEFVAEVKVRLSPGGAYALAFIGSFDDGRSEYADSMLRTFSESFPERYVFAFGDPGPVRNYVVVGVNGPSPSPERLKALLKADPEAAWLAERLVDVRPDGGVVLSDDRAPVEAMLMPLVGGFFRDYYSGFFGKII